MRVPNRLPYAWNAAPGELAASYPCDALVPGAHVGLLRAVDVAAPAPAVFRWLCQLRAAPYSYDWLDNSGRRSPRTLTPGLERLEVGQTFMELFELAAFEDGHHVTLKTRSPRTSGLFGIVAVSYVVAPAGGTRSRLAVKMVARFPATLRVSEFGSCFLGAIWR